MSLIKYYGKITDSKDLVTKEYVDNGLDDKQDSLPTIVNDRYLHTNASTGALEWSQSGGGASVHNELTGRDATGAHPMSAITGLESALADAVETFEIKLEVVDDNIVFDKTYSEIITAINDGKFVYLTGYNDAIYFPSNFEANSIVFSHAVYHAYYETFNISAWIIDSNNAVTQHSMSPFDAYIVDVWYDGATGNIVSNRSYYETQQAISANRNIFVSFENGLFPLSRVTATTFEFALGAYSNGSGVSIRVLTVDNQDNWTLNTLTNGGGGSYLVTLTTIGDVISADKTVAEIATAIRAGMQIQLTGFVNPQIVSVNAHANPVGSSYDSVSFSYFDDISIFSYFGSNFGGVDEWDSAQINVTEYHIGLMGRDAANSHPMSAITGLSDALSAKANDSAVVHRTGDETIAGIKTFDDNTFFNGTATWANCDPNFTSQYMYGMYQWDNMFQFTKRTTANTYINEAWHIQLDSEQTVFNYPTSFASRPTIGGVQVALKSDTGELSDLSTTTKTNLVSAVNELFTSVSSGKATVASAITDKGVTTASDATFATMATNIRAIPGGGITPSGNIELTQQSGTDVTNYATASVRRGSAILDTIPEFDRVNHSVTITPIDAMGSAGWIDAIADGIPITITPSDLGAVVPSGNKELTQQSGTDVTNYETASVRSAAVTVSAAKSVSNHTATVTPSVAVGTSGWIGNGASGTPVTVSAADLGAVVPSGSLTKTANGTYDVTTLAQLVVAIPTYDGSVS